MNNFEKYTFIKEKLNAPRFDNEDEEIDWFTKHLYGLYNQASRLREENNNYMARIDKYKQVLDKIKEYIEHENFKRNVLLGLSEKKYTRDILNHILEMIEETK